jgi:uncharacterized protein YndB with AHSA1/START domain
MTSHVHEFDAREGGSFRISLTYDAAERTGKTSTRTEYRGRFVKFVPNEQLVQMDEFESTEPDLRGEMTITITLVDADGGTRLLVEAERRRCELKATDFRLRQRARPPRRRLALTAKEPNNRPDLARTLAAG